MYNINTKAKRTELLSHIKESRINKGYKLEVFEGLQIFTKFDDLVNKFILEVYCDNSTKPLLNYYYANEAQMITRIEQTKSNYISRQQYKAERKANQGKKITLATLKTFFNKHSDNIFIKELSRFDGMVDCVMPTQDEFSQVKRSEDVNDRDLGFSGCWLVGSSRDNISLYEDDIYTGFQVYNACGSWIAATPKQVKQEVKPTQTEVKQGSVDIIEYGKGLAVIGETYAIKDKLKSIGGRFNKFLTCGAGWVFTSDKLEEIKTMLLSLKESKEVQQAEEVQEVSTEVAILTQKATITAKKATEKECNWFNIKQGGYILTVDSMGWFPTELVATVEKGRYEDGHNIGLCIGGNLGSMSVGIADLNKAKELLKAGNYIVNTVEDAPEVYTNLKDINEAAKDGKVISLCNLFNLVGQDQRKAIN